MIKELARGSVRREISPARLYVEGASLRALRTLQALGSIVQVLSDSGVAPLTWKRDEGANSYELLDASEEQYPNPFGAIDAAIAMTEGMLEEQAARMLKIAGGEETVKAIVETHRDVFIQAVALYRSPTLEGGQQLRDIIASGDIPILRRFHI